jgi:hypothetical protein
LAAIGEAGLPVAANHGHLAADQFGGERRQPIELTLGPAIFDCQVLALDEACVFGALAKSAQPSRMAVKRLRVKKPDHRHRRLLRMRGEGPRRCRAAE